MGRLLAILTLCAAIPAAAQQAPFSLTFGAVDCEFTRCGLDTIRWRDRPVFGDLAEDPRPAVQFVLLKQGWSQLAAPTLDGADEPRVQRTEDAVTVELSGTMTETGGGPGRWEWSQTWQVKRSGLLSVDYSVRQLAAPQEGWWLHRLALIGNRDELFVEPPNQDLDTPGKPIPIETRAGSQVAPPFGGKDSIVRDPARVRLPFAGQEVLITCDLQARSVELWNGWWRQNVNFELPVREQVSAHFEFDISQLPQTPQPTFILSPIVREPEPWAGAEIPPFPPVQRPLRFAQNAPTIIAWGEVRGHGEQELERFYAEMQKHFDILELMVGWTDWKWDLDWNKDEGARKHAEAIAAEVRKQIRIAHKHGMKLALSLNFGGSGPGTGSIETRRQPPVPGRDPRP